MGTREFFTSLEAHRYRKEWHIPVAANFAATRGLKVLEIGCGMGTDGAQFAKAGADYTGVDLTEAAIELARKRFALSHLNGEFRVSDAENLDFDDESFDLVYSHGVLHHTPNIAAAVSEIHRVLKPRGQAIVMLYHRDSYNYRIGIRVLRRAGAGLLKSESGIKIVHTLTGEPVDSLREHAASLRNANGNFAAAELLNRRTDGAGIIGSHLVSRLLSEGGWQITVVDDFNDFYDPAIKRAAVAPHLSNPNYKLIEADIRNYDALTQACTGLNFDFLVHLAARAGV